METDTTYKFNTLEIIFFSLAALYFATLIVLAVFAEPSQFQENQCNERCINNRTIFNYIGSECFCLNINGTLLGTINETYAHILENEKEKT